MHNVVHDAPPPWATGDQPIYCSSFAGGDGEGSSCSGGSNPILIPDGEQQKSAVACQAPPAVSRRVGRRFHDGVDRRHWGREGGRLRSRDTARVDLGRRGGSAAGKEVLDGGYEGVERRARIALPTVGRWGRRVVHPGEVGSRGTGAARQVRCAWRSRHCYMCRPEPTARRARRSRAR